MNFYPGVEVPWLSSQMEQLRRSRLAGRFPTGLLIADRRGAGGLWLAHYAAQVALCSGESPPCGKCRECRQFLSSQHPDFTTVGPIEESKYIRVEQIRDLTSELSLTAHGGGAGVALLYPADTMNANAANALLKTLEEPRAGLTLILVTEAPARLPATVLSRCQKLRIGAPSRAASIEWLNRTRGEGPWAAVLDVIGEAPFEAALLDPAEVARVAAETFRTLNEMVSARQEASSLAGIAERWAKVEQFELRLTCIETWITACIDRAAGSPDALTELRSGAHLPESSSDMNTAALLRLLDAAYELRRLRLTSINRGLALEQMLWQLTRSRSRMAAAS
jgi:DNA polymerase-3 subunit delta'